MIVLDACILISHFGSGNAHSDQALEILVHEEELLVHPLTLAEVLVGAVKQGVSGQLIEALETIGIEQADANDVSPMELAAYRVEDGLKMPDCCVLGLAAKHGATLATFDAKLAKAGRNHGLEVMGA